MSLKHTKHQQGFTVIELTLAMAFLAFILVFVVTTIVQILGVYNKGLTVKAINQSGRSVASEMQRSIRAASPDQVNTTRVGQGRFCTGGYSYVWSTDNGAVTPAIPSNNITNRIGSGIGTTINFARFYDPGGGICATAGNVSASFSNKMTELIGPSLRIRSLQITRSVPPNSGMFAVRFVITSEDPSAIQSVAANKGSLTESDYICRANDRIANQFCAANLFVMYAYAKN